MAQIGLKDVYYALLTSDATGNAVYSDPVRISGAMTANINPNPATGTLFADDGPSDTAATLGEISLELGMSDLPLEAQSVLLGHAYDATKGILSKAGSDVSPWLALGFRSLKSDGTYRYYWLTKGKFSTPEEELETKGDSINFKTPTITGSFVKREADDKWQLQTDSSITAAATTVTGWFTKATLAVGGV